MIFFATLRTLYALRCRRERYNGNAVAASTDARYGRHCEWSILRSADLTTMSSSLDPRVNRSLRYSLRDGVAYSVMSGAAESYLSAFALFLKASAQEVAWLASVPPLIGSWAQLLSAWLARRGVHRKRLIVGGALAQALLWIPIALLPLGLEHHAVGALIVCVVAYHAAGNLIAPQWNSLMGDLVPERRRGRYFARRTRYATVASTLALAGAGVLLHWLDGVGHTLAGYVALFGIAVAARLVSASYLARMYDPGEAHAGHGPGFISDLGVRVRALLGSDFLRFSLSIAAMQGAVAIAAPMFAVHMLRDLQFSYLQFMANTASSVLVQIIMLNAWGRIADRLGNRAVFVTTGWVIPLVPLLWILHDGFWYLCAVQMLSGLCWAGFSLSSANFLYDLRPGRPLASYLALHAVLGATAVFAGAMLGGALAEHLPQALALGPLSVHWAYPLYGVMAVSALARVAAMGLLVSRVREVRTVPQASLGQIIFRVARFNPVTGVVFELVAAVRRGLR